MNLLHSIKADFRAIPFSVKWVVLMFSLWMFGWGFADPLFSLYLKAIIPDYAIIGILASIPNLMAMLLAIPLGELEDHFDPNVFLKYGLLSYVFLGLMYLVAGVYRLIPLLLFALFFNGIISAMVMLSARTYVKQKSTLKRASIFVGLLNMFLFWAYGIAMFLAFYVSRYYTLNTVFLTVIFTSLLAYLGLSKVFPQKGKKTGLQDLWKKIMRFENHHHPFQKVFFDFKKSGAYIYYALILIFFVGLVENMTMVFIPLFADELGFGLNQISLLIGMMYLPYIFSFFFAEIADRYEKINVATGGLILASMTMFFMYFTTNDTMIAVSSALIAVALALINPAVEGLITCLTPLHKRGEITGLSVFFHRGGKFFGPLILGFLASSKGIHCVFLVVSILAIWLAIFSFLLKYKMRVALLQTSKKLSIFNFKL